MRAVWGASPALNYASATANPISTRCSFPAEKYARQNQKSPISVHSRSNSIRKFPTCTAHRADKTPEFCHAKSIFRNRDRIQPHTQQSFRITDGETPSDKTLTHSAIFTFCPTTIRLPLTKSRLPIRIHPRHPRSTISPRPLRLCARNCRSIKQLYQSKIDVHFLHSWFPY
jgi:hypothetical protein